MIKLYTEEIAKEVQKKMAELVFKEEWTPETTGVFKVIASDQTIDRAWETILASGRDLENYMKNPIILFGHDYRDIENIVGKATRVYVENNALVVEGVFASTEYAQVCRTLYDEGILKTVSVGFIPLQRDAEDTSIITKAELLELSFVPVPCNPNALDQLWKEFVEKGMKIGIIAKDEETPNGDDPITPVDDNAKLEEIEKVFEKFAQRIEAKIDTSFDAILKNIQGISAKGDDKPAGTDEQTTEEKLADAKTHLQKIAKDAGNALRQIKL